MCVQVVGCDQILGSKASLDACGVCKGDNSTCKFFKGQYTLQHRANGKLLQGFELISFVHSTGATELDGFIAKAEKFVALLDISKIL